jgi:N6-L-threonylcarbamoyladenine synthase
MVLAIETSCDDTSVALVDAKGWVRHMVWANQDAVHRPFGGVVPEIAGRNHLHDLMPLVDRLISETKINWSEITGIAVTNRPGLVGSLLVGLVTAKTLALAYDKPFIGVHHIEGHILSAFLSEAPLSAPLYWTDPFLALVVSGGHSHLYEVKNLTSYRCLGQTQDDAAGEAFDKFAKILGLGYPGGVHVDRLAKTGDIKAFPFPRATIKDSAYDFSFSGLKSAGHRLVQSLPDPQSRLPDLCASYQEAIVSALLSKLEKAVVELNIKKFVITGGVSANSRLREQAQELATKRNCQMIVPPLKFCTDNAAMIGLAGALRLARGETSAQTLAPQPRADLL